MREIEGIRLYKVAEVAELLGVTAATVRGHIKTGRLKATRLGRGFTVTGDNLRALITGNRPQPSERAEKAEEVLVP
jgi:excisionase family DNA binding protein